MLNFGLCCQFKEQPIKFKTATVKYALLNNKSYLEDIYSNNIKSLFKSIDYCYLNNIRAFRVSSNLFPLATHPNFNFDIKIVADSLNIIADYAKLNNVVLSLHPDQFVVLNSLKENIINNSIRELIHQVNIAKLLGAEQITLHAGGVYGDKTKSIERLVNVINDLPSEIKQYLCLENDDKSYTPKDIINICELTGCRFIYDVFHHKCNPDDLTIQEATNYCIDLWYSHNKNIEGWVHISSSYDNTSAHSDFIDINDFPKCWYDKNLVIDVEAKFKEISLLQLRKQLENTVLA